MGRRQPFNEVNKHFVGTFLIKQDTTLILHRNIRGGEQEKPIHRERVRPNGSWGMRPRSMAAAGTETREVYLLRKSVLALLMVFVLLLAGTASAEVKDYKDFKLAAVFQTAIEEPWDGAIH